jgi:hypothetical protein
LIIICCRNIITRHQRPRFVSISLPLPKNFTARRQNGHCIMNLPFRVLPESVWRVDTSNKSLRKLSQTYRKLQLDTSVHQGRGRSTTLSLFSTKLTTCESQSDFWRTWSRRIKDSTRSGSVEMSRKWTNSQRICRRRVEL